MTHPRFQKNWAGLTVLLLAGCASVAPQQRDSGDITAYGTAYGARSDSKVVSRSPASVPSVLRKLFAETSDEGGEWLLKHLGKDGSQASKNMSIIRNGLATLRPAEIREDQELVRILAKEATDVTDDEVKYLLKVASTRAVQLANCPECAIKRTNAEGAMKLIKAALMKVAGSDEESRKQLIGFIKRVDTLMAKDMVDPKAAHAFVSAVRLERFKGSDIGALTDTMHLLIASMGKDLDPKAAAEIINNWPEGSLKGLRRFYSEVMMAQTAEGLEIEAAAESVLRKMSVTDPEEIKALKVCSLLRR